MRPRNEACGNAGGSGVVGQPHCCFGRAMPRRRSRASVRTLRSALAPGRDADAVRRVAALNREDRIRANRDRSGYTLTVNAPTNSDARADCSLREIARAEGAWDRVEST